MAEEMKQLEFNLEQHIDAQLVAYEVLEQYMSTTDLCFGQLSQQFHEFLNGKLASKAPSATNEDHGRVFEGSLDSQPPTMSELGSPDLSSILKVLKVDVPKFNGQLVHNWLYTIKKLFSLHVVPALL